MQYVVVKIAYVLCLKISGDDHFIICAVIINLRHSNPRWKELATTLQSHSLVRHSNTKIILVFLPQGNQSIKGTISTLTNRR